jgi:hypothetical protein
MKSPHTIEKIELDMAVERAAPLAMTTRNDYSTRGSDLIVRLETAETLAALEGIVADMKRVQSELNRITR